mmetsp:Transcript_40233/g.99708  ORF Transcript_40233/g.99708 Transcript_40233/m.99708 type:complete len:201 (-) Transcript_40233:261-863(-)
MSTRSPQRKVVASSDATMRMKSIDFHTSRASWSLLSPFGTGREKSSAGTTSTSSGSCAEVAFCTCIMAVCGSGSTATPSTETRRSPRCTPEWASESERRVMTTTPPSTPKWMSPARLSRTRLAALREGGGIGGVTISVDKMRILAELVGVVSRYERLRGREFARGGARVDSNDRARARRQVGSSWSAPPAGGANGRVSRV